jgi:type IV secretory pathway protease TraF
MTKTRKSTKTVGSKIILYTVLALIVFIVIGTASDRQMVSEASAITSEAVPSGVYALRNVRSGYYLNVSSYEEGTYVMVEDLGHVPSSAAERAYMFRIEQIGTTGRYAIRTMSNNKCCYSIRSGYV